MREPSSLLSPSPRREQSCSVPSFARGRYNVRGDIGNVRVGQAARAPPARLPRPLSYVDGALHFDFDAGKGRSPHADDCSDEATMPADFSRASAENTRFLRKIV